MTGPLLQHCTFPYSASKIFDYASSPDPPKMVGLLPSPSFSPWVCCIELAVLSLILRWDKFPIVMILFNTFFESKSMVSPCHLLSLAFLLLPRLTGPVSLAHFLPLTVSYLSCSIFSRWGTLWPLLHSLYRRPNTVSDLPVTMGRLIFVSRYLHM